jgi:D-alanyl-D-alanine carboxypeptidase
LRLVPFRFASLLALAVALICSGIAGARPASAGAVLLIEADTGKVLHAENATYPWYPASITKIMTAYVTLRAVKEGRIKLDTLFTVSDNAVAQQPTKMGFPAGTQVTVDNALKMMMVKSANDMAVVLAEGVSGSIEEFANEMNRAGRRIGMTQSSWVNPNGLPADEQITSARDMAILARAAIREMPEYEMYWRIPAIKFGRRVIRNYNRLIDHFPGADGMKTGFICASGYNLVATATRNGKRLIAVVMGSSSGKARTDTAAKLLENGFSKASVGALGWLMPSVGTVDSLQPIAAAPPNLRDEICGRGRKHRTDHAEEEEQAGTPVDSASAAYAAMMPNFRAGPGTLLLDLPPSMPPVPVSVIPVRGMKTLPDGAPDTPVKIAKKKGRKTVVIRIAKPEQPAAEAKTTETPKPAKRKVAAKPKPAANTTTMEKPEPKKPAAASAAKPRPAPVKKKPATTAAVPSATKQP